MCPGKVNRDALQEGGVGYCWLFVPPQPVQRMLLDGDRRPSVVGVVLEDGSEIRARAVLSNATPKITFLDLLPQVARCQQSDSAPLLHSAVASLMVALLQGTLPKDFEKELRRIDYTSPVTKINGIYLYTFSLISQNL